jgi:hypothetical protein
LFTKSHRKMHSAYSLSVINKTFANVKILISKAARTLNIIGRIILQSLLSKETQFFTTVPFYELPAVISSWELATAVISSWELATVLKFLKLTKNGTTFLELVTNFLFCFIHFCSRCNLYFFYYSADYYNCVKTVFCFLTGPPPPPAQKCTKQNIKNVR